MTELALNDFQLEYIKALLESECVSLADLESWLGAQTEEIYDLAEQLTLAGVVSESDLIHAISRALKTPVASDIELEMFAALHPKIPREVCADFLMIPMSDGPKDPFPIAMSNPLDMEVIEYVSSLVGVPLKVHLAAPSHLRQELEACYGSEEEWQAHLASLEGEEGQSEEPAQESAQESAQEPIAKAPVSAPNMSPSLQRHSSPSATAPITLAQTALPIPDWSAEVAHADPQGTLHEMSAFHDFLAKISKT